MLPKIVAFVIALSALIDLTSAVQTITVTATGSCSASPPFGSVTVYNTTNSAGATFLTTATIGAQSIFTSVSFYTSTNSNGSEIVGSTTITNLPSTISNSREPTSTTSNSSRGSSSRGSTLTASSTSNAPAASPSAPCPQAAFAQIYNSKAGAVWQIFCSADVYYYNLPSVTTSSFEECIDACDAWKPSGSYEYPCVAISWAESSGGPAANCQLKYGVSQVVYGTSNYCSAKLANYVLPPDFPVSVVSSRASQATSATSATTLTYATGTQVKTYESASPCPLSNGSLYTPPDGRKISYEVYCGVSLRYNDLQSIVVGSFEDCMAACNDWVPAPPGDPYDQPCIAVTYIGYDPQLPSCFRHYATNRNSVVNDHPYGDSAVRKDQVQQLEAPAEQSERRELQEFRDGTQPKASIADRLVEARALLAEQGIKLVVLS